MLAIRWKMAGFSPFAQNVQVTRHTFSRNLNGLYLLKPLFLRVFVTESGQRICLMHTNVVSTLAQCISLNEQMNGRANETL